MTRNLIKKNIATYLYSENMLYLCNKLFKAI